MSILNFWKEKEKFPPWYGLNPSSLEDSLRFMEGRTIQKIEHKTLCRDAKPVVYMYFTDGSILTFCPLGWKDELCAS
jgi:hypothetical protein